MFHHITGQIWSKIVCFDAKTGIRLLHRAQIKFPDAHSNGRYSPIIIHFYPVFRKLASTPMIDNMTAPT